MKKILFLLICLLFSLGIINIVKADTKYAKYITEGNNAYHVSEYDKKTLIEGVEVSTFEDIGFNFAKDKNQVYGGWSNRYISVVDGLADANISELIMIHWSLMKDNKNIFYVNCSRYNCSASKVDVDYNSFEIFGDWYIVKDKNGVYASTPTQEDNSKLTKLNLDTDTLVVYDKYYFKDKDKVFFGANADDVNSWPNTYADIEGADSKSFEVIDEKISKDKNYGYCGLDKLEDSDPKTIEYLNYIFVKDKNYVWNCDRNYSIGILIEGADATTFEALGSQYAKDKNKVYYESCWNYYCGVIETNIDPNTVELLSNAVLKDKDKVYISGDVIWDDVENFEYIDNYSFRDKSTGKEYRIKYYRGGSTSIYPIGEESNDCSNSNNTVIGGDYTKSFLNACLQKSVINGANPDSFEVIKFPYSKDSNQIFYFWDPIPAEVDLKTFKILDNDYSRDKNNIYYKNTVMGIVNPATFKLNYKDDYQAEDEKNYFYKGKFLRTKTNTSIEAAEDNQLFSKLKGKIVLKVEDAGEAYYLNPRTNTAHYLGRPIDAFQVMREQGLGVSENNFNSYNGYAPRDLSGVILLRVEANGEAYYVNPEDLKMHYLGRPSDAFNVMRNLGLGISSDNFENLVK